VKQEDIESIGRMLLRAKVTLQDSNAPEVLWEIHERLAYCFERMSGLEGSIYGLPSTVGKFKKEG
jgi:hypothetical protein